MLHSKIEHQSKEMDTALVYADGVQDLDDIPVVVLLGVSGAGKTRTAYDVAKSRYTVYFEASTNHSKDLSRAITEMTTAKLRIPLPEDILQIAESQDVFEQACAQIATRLMLARVLTLLLLHLSGKATSPTDWLLAQLNGGGEVSLEVFNTLVDLIPTDFYSSTLDASLKICKTLGFRLTVITDEAHLLLHELPRAFRRPSYKTRPGTDTYSPHKGVKTTQCRAFLSFWIVLLRTWPLLPLVCGTALQLRDLELIRSAVGRTDKVPIVVKDFPYLDQRKVVAILHFHLDLAGIPDKEVQRIASELTGVFGSYYFSYYLLILP
jgi:hypothetical protein